MKIVKPFILAALLSLSALTAARPAAAQVDDLRNEAGYLDLDGIAGWFEEEPWLEVNIRGALLRLVTEASRSEDPELTSILENLKAIEVRGYPLTPAQFEDVGRRTGVLAKELEAQGWETVVRVREEDQRVNVYMKVRDDVIAGLVVMVLEPDDEEGAVFVNIVGDINPEQIGRIGRALDIDPLSNGF
ncbi:MAG: DUF4252 domain-containing protein [Rhodothermales bacterium]